MGLRTPFGPRNPRRKKSQAEDGCLRNMGFHPRSLRLCHTQDLTIAPTDEELKFQGVRDPISSLDCRQGIQDREENTQEEYFPSRPLNTKTSTAILVAIRYFESNGDKYRKRDSLRVLAPVFLFSASSFEAIDALERWSTTLDL